MLDTTLANTIYVHFICPGLIVYSFICFTYNNFLYFAGLNYYLLVTLQQQ